MSNYTHSQDLDSYLSGLFDGEGCIHARVNKTKTESQTFLKVCVHMRDKNLVSMFANRFGGKVHSKRNNGFNNKIIYMWEICGSSAIPALEVFSNLCIGKKPQAVMGLQLALLILANKRRTNMAEDGRRVRMRMLNPGEMERRIHLCGEITRLKRIDN